MLLLRWVGALFVTLLALLVLVITLPRLAHPIPTDDWLLLRRCALPCWNGIIVGKTYGSEAQDILRQMASVTHLNFSDPTTYQFVIDSPVGELQGTIFLANDEHFTPIVYIIRFSKSHLVSRDLLDQRRRYYPRLLGYGFYMAGNSDLFTPDQAAFLYHYGGVPNLFMTCSVNFETVNVNLLIAPLPYVKAVVNRAFCA